MSITVSDEILKRTTKCEKMFACLSGRMQDMCVQDGAKWGDRFSCGLNIVLGKMTGGKYQQFLDSIQAYYYFPIAKEEKIDSGTIEVLLKPEAGCLDRMGGLAFGIRNVGNYFILTVDALESTFAIFEFINNRRFKRGLIHTPIESGRWYTVTAEISGSHLKGMLAHFLSGSRLTANRPRFF